ncbi:MAG: T9SS type A sorting domain-containing protein [Bacteroidetes bacterium]|nr:T9SS type A sorting domain-containing protein [Bacteroidota bacterium]
MKTILSLKAILLIVACLSLSTSFATKHVIDVQNYSFSPASITDVVVGDTMRWVWVSGSHTTTSTTIPASAATWDHPINSSNTSFEYKVTVAGTYNYKCTPHAAMGMVGSFIATGATPTLTVLPANRNVPATAGTTTFAVTSNSSWTTSSNSAWCSVNAAGSGNGTITAVYSANPTVTQRMASITVTVAGLTPIVVTVTQAGVAPTISIDPIVQSVSYLAGTTSFNVISNTAWTTSCDRDWCSATPSGSGNGSIIATYSENPDYTVRSATITVTGTGLDPVTLTVTQDMSHVSVTENPSKSLTVFPNPSKGHLTVSPGNNRTLPVEISILNTLGIEVYKQQVTDRTNLELNLSSYDRGTYFVKLTSVEGSTVSKLLLIN